MFTIMTFFLTTAFLPPPSIPLSSPSSTPSSTFTTTHTFQPLLPSTTPTTTTPTTLFGILDDLKLIFSDEGKAKRKAYEDAQLKEQEEALAAMKARRRNPSKMEEYDKEVARRRRTLREEREVWNFQTDSGKGDPKKEWDRLRGEGKIKVGSEMERDKGSERLGSEGLVEVRTDERLPYIDQGWVEGEEDEE